MAEFNLEKTIAGCLKNKRRYQERLYRHYFDTMFRSCRRYAKSDDHGLELLNAGFMQVFKSLPKYQPTGSFDGWMRRVIVNAAIDVIRSENRHQCADLEQVEEQSIEDDVYGALAIEDILNEVESLPQSTRQVFELYVLDGLTHREIAERMQISDGTSKWHLNQARTYLKSKLQSEYNHLFEKTNNRMI
ncbi:MAG: sigma-70 family RNA polymerase sigma factor [Bacteroidetes bacterium]|nr:sigma-70 family RNA polymerase sigma factor [Bacteroidota bacterium]